MRMTSVVCCIVLVAFKCIHGTQVSSYVEPGNPAKTLHHGTSQSRQYTALPGAASVPHLARVEGLAISRRGRATMPEGVLRTVQLPVVVTADDLTE